MFDFFKWISATILHCALMTSPMLMAQETPPAENPSAQRPEAILPDTAHKPPQVTESEVAESTGIYLELPPDPALVGTFRRLAEALSMKYKIQILDAGTSASGPELIEAELRLKQDAEFDKVEKVFGTLARFKVARVQLFSSFEDQNMIVINAPANASWKLIHDIETDLAKLEDFRFDIRVRANENPPIPTFTDSGTIPDLFGFGESESHIPPESPMPSNASVPTVAADEEQLKIFHLQNSDANQIAAVIEQLFGGAIVTVAVDARTNSLIVRSNEPLLQQIEAILLRLDEQPGKQAPIVSSTTGTTANSTITITPDATSASELPIVPIAEYRRRLNELEQPLLQLAEKVRSAEASLGKEHPECLKQRVSLRESIQNTFATRQEIQRAELAEFTRRLRRMQQSIDSRDLIADKIVDRRLEELLNPEASWNADSSRSDGSLLRRNVAEPKPLQGRGAVSGLVQSVSGLEVQISLGIDDGVQPRDRLAVLSGLDSDNVIEVTAVQQDCSVARIVSESEEFRISVGDPVSEQIPVPVAPSAEAVPYFRSGWHPKSDAEKAIGRLVLVFFEDKARRAVPALLIQHGQETIALTTGPATIVPENIEHAIDRTFLEFYDREDVPTTYADFNTPDLAVHIAKEQLTSFRLENPVAVKTGDILSAILMRGQADFEVTANAARVTAVEQKTTWQLPSHELNREFTGLIQIDQRFPEGTPLFKDGQLAGITLLGTRFMKDDVPGSYVVPASRIVEVLQQLKSE